MRSRDSVWITPRETEILKLIAEGLADKEIAARLGISGSTVATHLERLFTRMKVHSRAQAVARYCDFDGVDPSDSIDVLLGRVRQLHGDSLAALSHLGPETAASPSSRAAEGARRPRAGGRASSGPFRQRGADVERPYAGGLQSDRLSLSPYRDTIAGRLGGSLLEPTGCTGDRSPAPGPCNSDTCEGDASRARSPNGEEPMGWESDRNIEAYLEALESVVEPAERYALASTEQALQEAVLRHLARIRAVAVLEMHKLGASYAAIARTTALHRSRIQQMVEQGRQLTGH